MNNSWKLTRIANGQLSCENSFVDENDIERIEKEVQSQFTNRLLEEHIVVMWDCWSGVFIMQNTGFEYTESTEQLLKEIFDFLITD